MNNEPVLLTCRLLGVVEDPNTVVRKVLRSDMKPELLSPVPGKITKLLPRGRHLFGAPLSLEMDGMSSEYPNVDGADVV